MKPEELDQLLSRALQAPPQTGAPDDALKRQAEAALAEPVQRWSRAALVAAGASLGTGLVAALWLPAHGTQHASEAVRWGFGGALALCGCLGALALRPGPRGPALAASAFAVAALVALPFLGSGVAAPRPAFGAGCGALSLALAAAPLAVGVWALSAFAATALRGALVGLAAGAAASLALHFHCPSGDALHLGLFHAGPWALLAALGALAVRRRPRTFAP